MLEAVKYRINVNSENHKTNLPVDQCKEMQYGHIRKWIYFFPLLFSNNFCQILFLFSACYLSDALDFFRQSQELIFPSIKILVQLK